MAQQRELQILMTLKDKMSKSLSNTKKHLTTFEKSASSLGSTLTKYLGVAALSAMTTKAVQMGAEFESISNSFNIMTQQVAMSGDKLLDSLQKASAGTVANKDLMLASNRAIALGVGENTEQITKLMEIARLKGRAMGLSTTQAFNDIVTGIGRASPLILDNLGITIKQQAAQEQYAAKLGKTVEQLTDYEKKNAILNAVLDEGQRQLEATGELQLTTQERFEKMNASIQNVTASLGRAFMPAINSVLDSLLKNEKAMDLNEYQINSLAKGIYRGTNFVIALGKSLNLLITVLIATGDTFASLGSIVIGFGKDVVSSFRKIKDNTFKTLKALNQALHGDFKGAWATIKEAALDTFSNTSAAMEEFKFNTIGWGNEISSQIDNLGKSMIKAVDLKGFQPIKNSAEKTYQVISKNTDGINKELNENGQEVMDLANKYKEFEEKADDALYELEKSHKDNLKSIRDEIKATEKQISDLNLSFEEQKKSDIQRVAEEVIRTEERIADLKEQLAGDVSSKRREELQNELNQQQKALKDNKGFIEGIEEAVSEARRRAGLTDLERAIEDFHIKRSLAQKEYNQKMNLLRKELQSLKQKEKQEIEMYNEKKAIIESLRVEAAQRYKNQLQTEFNMTKKAITAEIELYQELAKAIANVRGGDAADLSRFKAKAIGTKSGLNNINITINGDVSGEELVEKVKNGIMNSLTLNTRNAF